MSSSAPSSTTIPADATATPSSTTPLALSNSSNLYLVTFLATLLLLLFVSCAVVLRSYLLRRRFQRQLEEAITTGVILTPRSQGGRRRRFGTEPKFFTSWLVQGGERWDDIMPVSALPIHAKRRCKNVAPKHNPRNTQLPRLLPNTPTSPSSRGHLLDSWGWNDDLNCESPPMTSSRKTITERVDMLQVSVLIAMPSPNRMPKTLGSLVDVPGEEEDIPEMVFGVTRLPYKPPQ